MPDGSDLPLIQVGSGDAPSQRWNSWYDAELVTRKGENILEKLDDWAIAQLRKHKLVWSGWGEGVRLSDEEHDRLQGTPYGLRDITELDPVKLRLFIISLVWRAAATERFEFCEVVVPEDDLETMRSMLVRSDPGPINFYPAVMIQFSTRGVFHNQTPIRQQKSFPGIDDIPPSDIPIFRFYFDGLVIHIHRYASDKGETESLGNMVAGARSRLTVMTIDFENSFQDNNIRSNVIETALTWPNILIKL